MEMQVASALLLKERKDRLEDGLSGMSSPGGELGWPSPEIPSTYAHQESLILRDSLEELGWYRWAVGPSNPRSEFWPMICPLPRSLT